jgi:sugar porter (SP) family MFS transporter
MAVEADRPQDALTQLDDRVPTAFYWKLTLLATLGGFLFGYDTANIGSVLNFVPYQMDAFVTGYLVAGASIGAAVGAFAAGFLTDRFGRKSLLIADAGIYAAGAILSAVTWHLAVLLIARTLIGLAVGADSAIATAYIAEYAPKSRRGALSILQQWMITVGILVSYLVALIIFLIWPGSAFGADWRVILGLGAIPAIAGLILRTRMPESPRWLIHRGRLDDARTAFQMVGMDATTEDVQASADRLEKDERERAHRSLWTPGVKRALLVVAVFMVFQQITGINVPFYYGPKIMSPFFGGPGSDELHAAITGVEVTTIMAAVNVIATYFAFKFIDRIGRRRLAMGGFALMAVFMLLGAAGDGWLAGVAQIVVVMIALDLFIVAFAVGVGGTGWLIQGEVFPTAVRGRAAALGATADWVANFLLVQFFPAWQDAIGLPWVMVCFAVLAVLAVAFVAGYLPETKGLSVEHVTRIFARDAERGMLAPTRGEQQPEVSRR